MRIFKPTYSKLLPVGAKKFTCKRGKDAGKRFAKFKDRKGHATQARLTKAGNKILVETTQWYIEFEDNHGIKRKLKAYTNEAESITLAKRFEDLLRCQRENSQPGTELSKQLERIPIAIKEKMAEFGLLSNQWAAAGKPLTELVVEFGKSLEAKERTATHIKEITGMINGVFRDCGFVTWSDISQDILKNYLDDRRDGGDGISKRRYNSLLGAAKFFCRWMVRTRKAISSPIEYLEGLDNPQTDRRHPRRALDLNDFLHFLEAAITGEKVCGLTGTERSLLYRFAGETGLRKAEIGRLQVRDFNFKEHKFIIGGDKSKNKQRDTKYLKPAISAEIQQLCKNKLGSVQVFSVPYATARMVRFDLAHADPPIPYVDTNGEYFDFHSIRHTYCSLMGMNSEISEAVRQKAMRHLSPEMTRRYTHIFEEQQRDAAEAIPDLTQPSRNTKGKTGTGGS